MNDTRNSIAIQYCPKCQTAMDADSNFCKNCAFDVRSVRSTLAETQEPETPNGPSKSLVPFIAGSLVLIVLVGAIAVLGVYYLMSSSSPANDNTNISTKSALSDRALAIEGKILKGETLTVDDIKGLNSEELRILRNAHFAKYGRKYERPGLGDYFFTRPWYKPSDSYSDSQLTSTDKSNIDILLAAEKGTGPSPSQTESGTIIDPSTQADGDNGEGEDLGTPIENETDKEVMRFWSKFVAYCGDSAYMKNGKALINPEGQEIVAEMKGSKLDIRTENLSEADKMNGLEAKGTSAMKSTSYRLFDPRTSTWSDWSNGRPEITLFSTVAFSKKNGKWNIWGQQNGFDYMVKPITCSDVPK